MRTRLTKIKQYMKLRKSGLFDAAFYLRNNQDVRRADVDPLQHFIDYGWKERRDPSADFSIVYYLQQNPDIAQSLINPLLHYLEHGAIEGRDPNPDFSSEYYLKQNPDVLATRSNPLAHYLAYGRREGRLPRPPDPTDKTGLETVAVSIIIPVYNALAYTKACLETLFCQRHGVDFEVIVINNASTDGTKLWLDEFKKAWPKLRVIHNKSNRGFAPAVNQGLLLALGRYLVILNNDTLPASGWLEALVKAAENEPAYGILSPLTNYVGEGPQQAEEAKHLSVSEVENFALRIKENDLIVQEPRRLVFFCVLIKREVVDLIGLLDEGYIRGNFEDDDYCFRAVVAGFKLGIVQNAFVYHHGSATFKTNEMTYSAYFEENRERFFLKVGRFAARGRLEPKPEVLKHDWREPRISVIVRTVNRPDTLRVALNSLVHQTFKGFEVVLVNDGGPDIDALLSEYLGCLHINYLRHEKPKGRTPALNAGLQAARGQWITYLDDDDLYYPWHFAVMHQAAEQMPDQKFFFGLHNRVLIDADIGLNPIEFKPGPSIPYNRDQLLLGNFIPINTWFHARDLSDRGFDESFDTLEDYEFLLHLSKTIHFNAVNVPVCEYRFYLSQSNSIARLRSDTYMALQRLYERYKVKAPESIRERKGILLAQLNLIDAIERLTKGLDAKATAEKKHIFRKILDLVGAI